MSTSIRPQKERTAIDGEIMTAMRKPAARRSTLILVAGLLWSAVGVFLMTVASLWLIKEELWLVALFFAVGALVGWFYFRGMFVRLVVVNVRRIFEQAPGQDEVCVFAFQNLRSYFIAFLMMAMGYVLRQSPIPKVYLAPLYFAVGLGLLSSSIQYYRHLRNP